MIFQESNQNNFNQESLKNVVAMIIYEISQYQKNIQNKTNTNEIYYEYNLLSQKLFAIYCIANNEKIMSKRNTFNMTENKIPIEYLNFEPMFEKLNELYESGMSEKELYDKILEIYQKNPEQIAIFTLQNKEENKICDNLKKLNTISKVTTEEQKETREQLLTEIANELELSLEDANELYQNMFMTQDHNYYVIKMVAMSYINQIKNNKKSSIQR